MKDRRPWRAVVHRVAASQTWLSNKYVCIHLYIHTRASLVAELLKNLPAMRETWVQALGWEDALEKGKATNSSIPAWRTPRTAYSMGSQRVGHDWATFTFIYIYTHIHTKLNHVAVYRVSFRLCLLRAEGRGDSLSIRMAGEHALIGQRSGHA